MGAGEADGGGKPPGQIPSQQPSPSRIPSACSTADNQEVQLHDEGIYLMSGCQVAGFRHIIGSLWEVSDKHCVDVAKDVYGTMLKAGMNGEYVSQSLHDAVMNLRGGPHRGICTAAEVRNARLIDTEENLESRIGDPFIWAANIHMGK
jgi:CHAT domain-containing protein